MKASGFRYSRGAAPPLPSRLAPRARFAVQLALALVVILTALPARSQVLPGGVPGTIWTIAGGGIDEGRLATTVLVRLPSDVAIGPDGSLYVSDVVGRRVCRVSRNGVLTTVAGACGTGTPTEPGPAVLATLKVPQGLAVGPDGSLFIADKLDHRIRRVSPDGMISTVAGTGVPGFSGDGAPAALAQIASPEGISVGPDGSLYIADTGNNRIRRVAPDGIITTLAGTGTPGFSGDGGPATSASLSSPTGVSACPRGFICIADKGNNRIRRVTPDGTITTVAGNGRAGFSGDGGPATAASLNAPNRALLTSDGYLFIADTGNHRIARVGPDGVIQTICGTGQPGFSGDQGQACKAMLRWPQGLALASDGTLYVADAGNYRVRCITTDGRIDTVAGTSPESVGQEGTNSIYALLKRPVSVAACMCGSIYFVDTEDQRVRVIACCGTTDNVIGTGKPATSPISAAPTPVESISVLNPMDVTGGPDGWLFVSSSGTNQVVAIRPDKKAYAVAGTGDAGFSGDGGPAGQARLNSPTGLARTATGVLFVSDTGNHRVRRIGTDGTITTVAGNGEIGYSGDGGPATNARLSRPTGIVVLSDGTLYIADPGNHTVRKVTPDGIITTVAGTGSAGFSGDGGPAANAALNQPMAVAMSVDGKLFIADSGNNRVRQVDPNGIITTVAGAGKQGFSGDGGPATQALLDTPTGVAVSREGALLIADSGNARIRAVLGAANPVTTSPGDINADGIVDLADALLALRFATGLAQPNLVALAVADVAPSPGTDGRLRGDGRITIADVMSILRRALGLAPDPWP